MASFAIKSAGEWLGKLLVVEVEYLSKVKDKVEKIQRQLEWMQLFLLDANEKQKNDRLVRKWVLDISDLALEAEDVTEKYILKVSYKRKDGFINGFKWLACFWKDVKTLYRVGHQIDGLNAKLETILLMSKHFGVQVSNEAQLSLTEERRTYSHAQPDLIVGIELDVAKLVKQLEEGEQRIVVAHGMGGIGKTALAREVYHNCLAQGHFVGRAWAYVSQQFNLGSVCKDILYELVPKDDTEQRSLVNRLEESQLPGMICEILKKNNYLVVLDDVWTDRTWSCLEPAFPIRDSSCGSRIFVTTRNPQIFLNLEYSHLVSPWRAETLNEENSWELLENKGRFKRDDLDSLRNGMAKKMLDHCGGHPLAIVVLGGVLATKKSDEEWESVCENLQSHLRGHDAEAFKNKVYDVLALSYYDLHYNLKPCFLHMGHFPEDSRIDVTKLYNLWIADGIVSSTQQQSGSKRSLEDIADGYLYQLVQKGLIQADSKDDEGRIVTDDRIKICSLHDLMRDKCVDMTTEENFLQIVSIDEQQKTFADVRIGRARRLTIYVGEVDAQCVLESLSGTVSSLRSLMFISTCSDQKRKKVDGKWVKSICKMFKFLRILDFGGGVVITGSLPREIGNLIYLRYLCLQGTQITELPSSISNLKSLIVLDLQVNKVVIKLPNVLWEMVSLCNLYFPIRSLSKEGDNSLPHGYETEDGSPLILDKLTHLESLNNLDLDKVALEGLRDLTSMASLTATCQHKKESLLPFLNSPSIKHFNLKIDASLLTGDSSMLLSESRSLQILDIDSMSNPVTQLPIRVDMFPPNLVDLGFWYCMLLDDPMPVLEQLPNLRRLSLHICYNGREINCSKHGFPELNYLALDGLFSLQVWNVENGGCPKLQQVELFNAPLLKIPDVLPANLYIKCPPYYQHLVDTFRPQAAPGSDREVAPVGSRGTLQIRAKDPVERVFPASLSLVPVPDEPDHVAPLQAILPPVYITEPHSEIIDDVLAQTVDLPPASVVAPPVLRTVASGSLISARVVAPSLSITDFKPLSSAKITTSISSDLLNFVDLTMIKGSTHVQYEEVVSDKFELDVKLVLPSVPKPETDGRGKKSTTVAVKPEDEIKSEEGFSDHIAIGESLIQEFPKKPKVLADMNLTPAETLRYGLGMASQAMTVLVDGIRSSESNMMQIENLKADLTTERAKSLSLARDLVDKDARCVDLKTKLEGSEALVSQLLLENGDLKAEQDGFAQKEKDIAQYFFQYGKVMTMKEPEANRVHWNLEAEEAKL